MAVYGRYSNYRCFSSNLAVYGRYSNISAFWQIWLYTAVPEFQSVNLMCAKKVKNSKKFAFFVKKFSVFLQKNGKIPLFEKGLFSAAESPTFFAFMGFAYFATNALFTLKKMLKNAKKCCKIFFCSKK